MESQPQNPEFRNNLESFHPFILSKNDFFKYKFWVTFDSETSNLTVQSIK